MRGLVLVLCLVWCCPARVFAQPREDARLAKLLHVVDQGNDEQRWQALLDLAELGPHGAPAAPRLFKLLHSANEDLCLASCLALGKMGSKVAPPLIAALGDQNPRVRFYAAWALGGNGAAARSAIPALLKARATKDAALQRRVTWALGQIAQEPPLVMPVLLEALTTDPDPVDSGILEAIGRFGKEAIPYLSQAIQKAPEQQRLLALDALAAVGPASHPALAAVLENPLAAVRRRAAEHLDRTNLSTPPIVQGLIKALNDKDYETTVVAHIALGRRGADALAAVPALTEAMFGPMALNHARSLETFRALGHDPRPDLRKELNSRDSRRRALAAYWLVARLGEMGEAEKILDKELLVKDDDLRTEIAKELVRRRSANQQLVAVLVEYYQREKNSENRFRALQALHHLAGDSDKALRAMTLALKDPAPDLRADAARFLGDHGFRARFALPALREALNDPDATVRNRAKTALQQIDGP